MSKLKEILLLQRNISKLEKGSAMLSEIVKGNPSEMNKVCMRTNKELLMIMRRELSLRNAAFKRH